MDLTSKFTNVEEILERVKRDYGFHEVHLDDVREWVWDIMGIMGTNRILLDKTVTIKVENNRGELPVDLFSMTNSAFRDTHSGNILHKSTELFFQEDISKERTSRAVIDGESVNTFDDVDESGTKYISIVHSETEEVSDYLYTIKGNYIFTSLKEAELELTYQAFPMDDRYFPLIPDHPKIIRAVVSYIGERTAFKLMIADKLSERKYNMISQDQSFNIASARTFADTMSLPEMENFKNRVLSLLKQTDGYSKGFKR